MKNSQKVLIAGGASTAVADVLMSSDVLPVPETIELVVKAVIAIGALIKFIIENKKEKESKNG